MRSATPRAGSASGSRPTRTGCARCRPWTWRRPPIPSSFAFHGAAKTLNPYINIVNRLVIVQFEDFEGNLKTLAWEPTIAEGAAEAPFYDQLLKRYGEFLSYKVFANFYNTVEEAIARCGITPADVDYVSFDHLHVQDLRLIMGTTRPVLGESEPRKPFFPNAKFLFQRKEVDTFKSPHPTQWAWYVPGGMDDVIEDNLVLLDGDVELGKGVAIVWTPGHTDGNHSLVLNTDDGVWVTSENGVCADSWHPHQSKIPGIRKYAEFFNREVVMNANTLEDSIDQYDSMVKEKAIADPNRRDPRWLNVFPSSEMPAWRRQWPVLPTLHVRRDELRHDRAARASANGARNSQGLTHLSSGYIIRIDGADQDLVRDPRDARARAAHRLRDQVARRRLDALLLGRQLRADLSGAGAPRGARARQGRGGLLQRPAPQGL